MTTFFTCLLRAYLLTYETCVLSTLLKPEALGAAKRLLDACGGGGDETVAPREIAAAVYQMVARHGLQARHTMGR